MTFCGHQRSLILAPIESAYGTSYWSSIVRDTFPYRTPVLAKISGCYHWNRSVMFGSWP